MKERAGKSLTLHIQKQKNWGGAGEKEKENKHNTIVKRADAGALRPAQKGCKGYCHQEGKTVKQWE